MPWLLPGAPWPGLGAGGFRFAAAASDVSLLPSYCRRSLGKLQVGPAPSLPAPGRRLHHCEPAVGCWDPDPGLRPSAGYQEPISDRRQERCPARPALLLRSPCRGGVASPDLPGTPGTRAPPRTAASPSSLGRLGCCRAQGADPATRGRGLTLGKQLRILTAG